MPEITQVEFVVMIEDEGLHPLHLEEAGAAAVKIIDLGLAKAVSEAGFSDYDFDTRRLCRHARVRQSRAIRRSRRGRPFGPLFARSDALEDGDRPCALWGSPAEVMYQHQHAPLPLQQ